jgi:hypothetical protein
LPSALTAIFLDVILRHIWQFLPLSAVFWGEEMSVLRGKTVP